MAWTCINKIVFSKLKGLNLNVIDDHKLIVILSSFTSKFMEYWNWITLNAKLYMICDKYIIVHNKLKDSCFHHESFFVI